MIIRCCTKPELYINNLNKIKLSNYTDPNDIDARHYSHSISSIHNLQVKGFANNDVNHKYSKL